MDTWEWCDLCRVRYLRCGACGNNACNGGYGELEGKDCKHCPEVYRKQAEAWKGMPVGWQHIPPKEKK